ncbi:facilitated trehalose transporter Tret1-like [Diabrotica virgifera virgifera]|uniref:Facilitated trehalose transporter Tret1-like n=1 Tax=Diabrotica virgifera virgifera TaxID=50390 RepID=A0A6P7G1G3_DIAVI|nr:facilitated trehalose transporter Tret1-like [Diabrotica virgifera virgifera]
MPENDQTPLLYDADVIPIPNIESNSLSKETQKSSWIFYVSAFAADLLLLSVGSLNVFPSVVFPILKNNNTDINPFGEPMTPIEESIIMSVSGISALISFLLMAKISDKIGRKWSMVGLGVSLVGSFTALAFGTHVYIYMLAYFLNGFFSAGIMINVSIYNSEISKEDNRAWIGCIVGLSMPAGNLYGYIFGAIINDNVKLICLICALPCVLHLLLAYYLIESPTYLTSKWRKVEALKALSKLRRYTNYSDIEKEYQSIEDFSFTGNDIRKVTLFSLFKTRVSRKALLIGILLFAAQQLSGSPIIIAYLVPIFNDAGTLLSGNIISIIYGSLQLGVCILATFIVNWFGRKPLILISTLGCAISILFLGAYFYIKDNNIAPIQDIRLLPLACIVLFCISYGIALGPIPMVLIGELFRNEQRAMGVAIITIVFCLVSTGNTFSYPQLKVLAGEYLSLVLYGLITFVALFLLFKYLPETKGKSFVEIQEILSK